MMKNTQIHCTLCDGPVLVDAYRRLECGCNTRGCLAPWPACWEMPGPSLLRQQYHIWQALQAVQRVDHIQDMREVLDHDQRALALKRA